MAANERLLVELATVFCAAGLLLMDSTAAAQTVDDAMGAIDGKVTDSSGVALPGVVITASSPLLMGTVRRTASEGDGQFRIPALPSGVYALTFERTGFSTVEREGVRVTFGGTASLDVVLAGANQQETITVLADARVLDLRETRLATGFEHDELAQLPGSRSLPAILAVTPAVQVTRFDVGGSTAISPGPYGAFGSYGRNRPMLEGIVISNFLPLGFSLDYGAFQEVSIGTGAPGPEWAVPHVNAQLVTKSGGNDYHGTFSAGYENAGWQSHNIDREQIERGAVGSRHLEPEEANRLAGYHDVNADVGGFMLRDRAWWYVSLRDQGVVWSEVVFPVEPLRTNATTASAKGTFRLSDDHRAVVFVHSSDNRQSSRLEAFLRGATAINESIESTTTQHAEGTVWKAEWSAATDNVLFAARAGQFTAGRAETPRSTAPRFEDLADPRVRGGNRDWRADLQRDQLFASLSYFRTGPYGDHHLTIGGDVHRILAGESWNAAYPGDVLHVLRRGVPEEVYLFQTPSQSLSGTWWYSAYVNDAWQPHDRLTVNLGMRLDRYRVFLPQQAHEAGRFNPTRQTFAAIPNLFDANALAPRLGASHDLTADGKTLLKGSYGLYWLPVGPNLAADANPNSPSWWVRYGWSDGNGNGYWEPGEQAQVLGQRGGEIVESLDPGLKLGYGREVTARIERELAASFSIETGVVWRGERRPSSRQNVSLQPVAFTLEVPLPDPGPDGIIGNADDGPLLRLHDVPEESVGVPSYVVRNAPNAATDHLTFEFTARRRFAQRWSLLASFARTWSRDHSSGYFGQPVRANAYPITPNDRINTDDGRHVFSTWTAKVLGTYHGPWELRITPLVRHQSGQPFGRTVVARLNYGTIRVLAEPVGARRQDHVTIFDIRLEKAFPFGSGRRVAASFEVFNVLNTNAAQNVDWLSGPSFLRPLNVVAPRIARVGAKLEW